MATEKNFFDRCVSELSRLPGIGHKTAVRLSMSMLKMQDESVYKIAEAIKDLKKNTVFCNVCGSMAEAELCNFCSDDQRYRDTVCVVELPQDVFSIEQTMRYKGLYHVLGGCLSPLDGVTPAMLTIDKLIQRVEESSEPSQLDKNEQIKEIIIATNPSIEGETTATYIHKQLAKFDHLQITRIASGLPVGTSLEYVDDITLLRSFERRYIIK